MFRDEPMTSEEIWRMKISKSPKMSTGVPVPGVDTQLQGVSISYCHRLNSQQHAHKLKECLRICGTVWRCGGS
jgi:hypothetical protein